MVVNGGTEMILEMVDAGIGVLMSVFSTLWRLSELIIAAWYQSNAWGWWKQESSKSRPEAATFNVQHKKGMTELGPPLRILATLFATLPTVSVSIATSLVYP